MGWWYLLAGVLLVAALAGSPCAAEEFEDPSAKVRPVKIVCFGDSITFGTGAEKPQRQGYPWQLQKMLTLRHPDIAIEVVNAGIPGQDTRDGLKRIDEVLETEAPDWLLIMYGTNDLWDSRGIDLDETDANLREMVRRARAAGASVIIGTLGPVWGMDEKVAALNRVIKAVAIEEHLPFADINLALARELRQAGGLALKAAWMELYSWSEGDEGVHPNERGYRVIAREWASVLTLERAVGHGPAQ